MMKHLWACGFLPPAKSAWTGPCMIKMIKHLLFLTQLRLLLISIVSRNVTQVLTCDLAACVLNRCEGTVTGDSL